MLLASVCAFYQARQKNVEIDYNYEFLALIIFGYFCMVFLSEAQSRYKMLVMPYLCIFAAFGLDSLISVTRRDIKSGASDE